MSETREQLALPEQKQGQAKTMLICAGPDTTESEVGHWYSPDAVREIVTPLHEDSYITDRFGGASLCAIRQAPRQHCEMEIVADLADAVMFLESLNDRYRDALMQIASGDLHEDGNTARAALYYENNGSKNQSIW